MDRIGIEREDIWGWQNKILCGHSGEKKKAEMLVCEVWSWHVREGEGKQFVETFAPNTGFRVEVQLAH